MKRAFGDAPVRKFTEYFRTYKVETVTMDTPSPSGIESNASIGGDYYVGHINKCGRTCLGWVRYPHRGVRPLCGQCQASMCRSDYRGKIGTFRSLGFTRSKQNDEAFRKEVEVLSMRWSKSVFHLSTNTISKKRQSSKVDQKKIGHRHKSKNMQLRVTVARQTITQGTAAEIFSTALERMGLERVAKLNIRCSGIALVSRNPATDYQSQKLRMIGTSPPMPIIPTRNAYWKQLAQSYKFPSASISILNAQSHSVIRSYCWFTAMKCRSAQLNAGRSVFKRRSLQTI